MRIQIVTVNHKPPEWILAATNEYIKRLPNVIKIQHTEVIPVSRKTCPDKDVAMYREWQAIQTKLNPRSFNIALDISGSTWSTLDLAANFKKWQQTASNLCFVIGGSNGLATECLNSMHQRWSLSPLTLPHNMVRVIVLEQIYRTWTMLNNHPYHK